MVYFFVAVHFPDAPFPLDDLNPIVPCIAIELSMVAVGLEFESERGLVAIDRAGDFLLTPGSGIGAGQLRARLFQDKVGSP